MRAKLFDEVPDKMSAKVKSVAEFSVLKPLRKAGGYVLQADQALRRAGELLAEMESLAAKVGVLDGDKIAKVREELAKAQAIASALNGFLAQAQKQVSGLLVGSVDTLHERFGVLETLLTTEVRSHEKSQLVREVVHKIRQPTTTTAGAGIVAGSPTTSAAGSPSNNISWG